MNKRQKLGQRGERLAEEYFKRRRFSILERNYRYRRGEIDLIARRGNLIVFIEVKTRSSNTFIDAEQSLRSRQISSIREVAEHYLHEVKWQGEVRFDILTIEENGMRITLRHFEDAFY